MATRRAKTIYDVLGRDPVHPFPARMAPCIALDILQGRRQSLRVLDPMMGSGTVIAVARACGHRAIGFDIDPLAVLHGKVWTTTIDPEEVYRAAEVVLDRANRAFLARSVASAYPKQADAETRRFIRYWFDSYSRRQLACLADAIDDIRDSKIKDTLWCAYSRLIITKQAGASLAMDLSHSRPHKAYTHAPIKPFQKFLHATNLVVKNCISRKGERPRGPSSTTLQGDARALSLKGESIDLVLTSPPYLNAIDYMRCSKFSLVWMGYSIGKLSAIRSESVGTEVGSSSALENPVVNRVLANLNLRPKLSPRNEKVLAHYVEDLFLAVGEAQRVLVPGGKAVYVLGENTVRGTFIPNSQILAAVAGESGLTLENQSSRALPANRRYLPPPSKNGSAMLSARMRREVILTFTK